METIKTEIDKGERFYVDYFGYAETSRTTNIPPNFVDNIVVKFPSASLAANNNNIHLTQDKCKVVLVLPEIQSKNHPDNGYTSRQPRSGQTGPLCFRRISDSAECLEHFSPLEALLTIDGSSIEISSVSPSVKILSHSLSDITFCSQGITNPEYFGFIATLPSPLTGTGPDPEKSLSFISAANCHVFRCSSEEEVADVMNALKSAFQIVSHPSNQQKSHSPNREEHLGPIERLNKLCKEIQNKSFSEAHEILQRFIEIHHAQEHYSILRKIQEAGCETIQEANEIIVSCLLHLAEGRPPRSHAPFSDPPVSPSHASPHSQLSLSTTSSTNATPQLPTMTVLSSAFCSRQNNSPGSCIDIVKTVSSTSQRVNQEPQGTIQVSSGCQWQQSNTNTTSNDFVCKSQNKFPENSPMRTMFVNVGNSLGNSNGKSAKSRFDKSNTKVSRRETSTPVSCSGGSISWNNDYNIYTNSNKKYVGNHFQPHQQLIQPESWRFNILNKVVNTSKAGLSSAQYVRYLKDLKQTPALKMNYLWRKAIVDTMVLIKLNRGKMEENAEEEAPSTNTKEKQVKQMKADYDEITPCLKEVTKVWDELLMVTTSDLNLKVDRSIILDAVKAGVPRKRRGEIWIFLMQQKLLESLSSPSLSSSRCSPPPLSPLLKGLQMMTSTPYKELLKMWTQHQHAILIDLGRTFPGHPYFSTQLGSGQISLFNILKAYSLLDTEVGYCQGISFVAGILLMHIPEEKSFEVLKHMMFGLNFRNQYRPDMVHLQIQLYQLSRLLHDYHSDLYSHLEQHEISPTLYAAPWFLTIFASQFPLGFVARVFDLIFLHGREVVVKVAVVLLGNHKELIKQCDGFESVVEFLKTTLPEMSIIQMERIINQVFDMDISKQLEEYKLEYHVLREEMLALKHSTTESKSNRKKVSEVQPPTHPMSNQNGNSNYANEASAVQSARLDPQNDMFRSFEEMKLKNELLSSQRVEMPHNKLQSPKSSTNNLTIQENTNSNELRQCSPTSSIQKQFSDLLQYCISMEEILNKAIPFLPDNLTKEFEKTKFAKPKWLLWNLSNEPQTDIFDVLDQSKPIHPPTLSLQSNTCDSQLPPTSYSFWPPSPLSDGGIGCYLDREVEDFIGASMNIFPDKGGLIDVEVNQCQPILRNESSRDFKPRRPASNYY